MRVGSTAPTVRLLSVAVVIAAALVTAAVLITGTGSGERSLAPKAAGARTAAGSRDRTGSAEQPPNAAPGAQGERSTLEAVTGIVDRTAAGRQAIISSIDAVQSCRTGASDAQAAVAQVVVQRQHALAALFGVERNPSIGPTDRQAIQRLMAVIADSVQADQDYAAWMGDVASAPPACPADPATDPNFVAGQRYSAKADRDKQTFVAAWNPLAGAAGLATYRPQDF